MLNLPPFRALLIAGLIGQLSFELYAWLLSPVIFGVTLEPTNLVNGLILKTSGLALPYWAGFAIHTVIGVLGFAVFVWLVHLVTKVSLTWSGTIAGLILWFVAQGMLAPAMGRSFMMGFGTYTQSSFVAHVGMSILIGYVLEKLLTRNAMRAQASAA